MQKTSLHSHGVQFSVVYGYMVCAVVLLAVVAMSIPHLTVGP